MESDYNRYRKMDLTKEIQEWEDKNLESDFWEYWEEIKAFAEQNRLSVSYVEDEFLLEGELFPVHLKWQEDEQKYSLTIASFHSIIKIHSKEIYLDFTDQELNTITLSLSTTYYLYKDDVTEETEDLTDSIQEIYSRLTEGEIL